MTDAKKEHADAIFRPTLCERKSGLFRPQGWKTKQARGYVPSTMDRKEDCADAIFHLPLTKKETI